MSQEAHKKRSSRKQRLEMIVSCESRKNPDVLGKELVLFKLLLIPPSHCCKFLLASQGHCASVVLCFFLICTDKLYLLLSPVSCLLAKRKSAVQTQNTRFRNQTAIYNK